MGRRALSPKNRRDLEMRSCVHLSSRDSDAVTRDIHPEKGCETFRDPATNVVLWAERERQRDPVASRARHLAET
jgi:hypothetical protein